MKCIIIEDEIPAQNILKHYASKLPELEIIGVYQSALDANSFIKNNSIDLIFIDINLPDISGINFLKTLADSPTVIFTTAYPEYAVASYELQNICDYLVKPFSFERFLKAIQKAENKQESTLPKTEKEVELTKEVFINIDKTLHKLILKDILFIQSDKNYISIQTSTKKYTYLDALKNWTDSLPTDQFIQVHKSFIVNHTKVTKLIGNRLYILNTAIPIGRSFKGALLKRLKI